jgi:hypothetical protein
MIGLGVAAAGWVLLVAAVCVVVGVWTLIPAAVVMIVVGLFVDLDRLKESTRAKRHPSAP